MDGEEEFSEALFCSCEDDDEDDDEDDEDEDEDDDDEDEDEDDEEISGVISFVEFRFEFELLRLI